MIKKQNFTLLSWSDEKSQTLSFKRLAHIPSHVVPIVTAQTRMAQSTSCFFSQSTFCTHKNHRHFQVVNFMVLCTHALESKFTSQKCGHQAKSMSTICVAKSMSTICVVLRHHLYQFNFVPNKQQK